MAETTVTMDLGPSDVHAPGAMSGKPAARGGKAKASTVVFALPAAKKLPLDTASRVRSASSRIESMKRRGKIGDDEYTAARASISKAAKSFGVTDAGEAASGAKDSGKRRPRAIHIRADLAPGGALHVRHMTSSADGAQLVVQLGDGTYGLRDVRPIRQGDEVDPASAGITLMGKPTWKDGSPKKLIWVQLAETGAWNGHPAGPFEMSPATFSEIVSNFNRRGLPVPFDMEHASEQDPTSGSIPERGAPAPGWVHRMDNRGVGGLWGLVEWFDYAREKIQEGEIAFLSPAVRFGCKDPRSGQRIGARLTSVALTNQPFLTGLAGLRAASDKGEKAQATPQVLASFEDAVTLGDGGLLSRKVHSPHDVMPRLKSALKLHPLSSASDVSDHLGKLREMCMSADADGMCAGENLHSYMQPLTDIVSPSLGSSWEDVIDALDEFVDEEIEKHVVQGLPMPDGPSAVAAPMADDPTTESQDTNMSDKSAAALKEAQDQIVVLSNDKTALATEKATLASENATLAGENDKLSLQLKDAGARAEAAEKAVAEISGSITMKDGESVGQAIARIIAEHAKLLSDKAAREEADLHADVDVAFSTYKDVKKLSDKDKEAMLRVAKADREAFNALYPPVSPEQRHLMRQITPPEPRPKKDDVEESGMSFTALTRKLMSEAKAKGVKLTLTDAQNEASRLLRKRTG